jgi:hypothetical protein
MEAVYAPTKTLAAICARRRGFRVFETRRVKLNPDAWLYEERPFGAGAEYAELYAKSVDFVHHIEMTETLTPILVVTCRKDELPDDIPELFKVVPVTPELFDAKREPKFKPPSIRPTLKIEPNVPAALHQNIDPAKLAAALLFLNQLSPPVVTQPILKNEMTASELAAQLFSGK